MSSVSVVIPTYNGLALLKKYLPSVMMALRAGDELVIVDDASTDQTVEWLHQRCELQVLGAHQLKQALAQYPHYTKQQTTLVSEMQGWIGVTNVNRASPTIGQAKTGSFQLNITVLVNKVNRRFGMSSNLGVAIARNRLVLLLNNDVKPESTILSYLLPHFENSQIFAVGCLEYEKNRQGQKAGKNKLWFKQGLFWHSRAEDFQAGPTAWASGGSALFDKEKWLELGGFDPMYYPAYWEDLDLSFRAHKRGWHVLFEPKAVVYHIHESTHATTFGYQTINAMSWKNIQIFTWRNGELYQKLQYLLWKPYWWYKYKRWSQQQLYAASVE